MDEADYEWSKAWCEERKVWDRLTVLFSPVHGKLDSAWLAEAIVRDRLPVRFKTQLHKVIWGSERTGV